MSSSVRGGSSAIAVDAGAESRPKLQLHVRPDSAETDSTKGYHTAPSERELIFLAMASGLVMWATAFLLHRSIHQMLAYGDNDAYLGVAEGLRDWDFRHIGIQHFMGYPYLIAAVSVMFHVPAAFALWIIAAVSSVVSVVLAGRLFGGWVAAYFAVTNFAWLQLSFLGGSEPLAVALGLGAMLAFRRKHVFPAALLGGLAATVRPLMIFVLIGIGLALLFEKRFVAFLLALGTGAAIGALYVLPLAVYLGDPLTTVHSYTTRDYGGGGIQGPHGHLFGWPFHGIVAGTLAYPAPWTNLLLSYSWIGLVLAGTAMMFSAKYREFARKHVNEVIFAAGYLMAVFCYDYLLWARGTFMRFVIPALPLVFFAMWRWLPKDRRLVWGLCVVSAALATMSAIGIRNVVGIP